jgi:acyl-CoA thioesterase-1
MLPRRLFLSALLIGASACSLQNVSCGSPVPPEAMAPVDIESAASAGAGDAVRVAFLGDSLTAGYGLLSQQSFPAVLEEVFEAEGYRIEAVNAGMSGDTTAGGLRRAEQLMDARVLVIALGANDALRGLTVQQTQANLAQIIELALSRNLSVLLCGMEGPTNLGEDYRTAFRQVYFNLLREYQGRISYVPFLLEGVAGNPALNQADGIHPTAEGARKIAELLYPKVRELVDRAGGGGQ